MSPQRKVTSVADRVGGSMSGTHPRLVEGGSQVILLPDDCLERAGDFREIDGYGNPRGGRLVFPEAPDGRAIYGGATPDSTTTQFDSEIPYSQNSFLMDRPLREGDATATSQNAAKIPRPLAPIVKRERIQKAGYPASSEQTPYWIAFTFARRVGRFAVGGSRALNHTTLGPDAVVPKVGQGQTITVTLPEEVPDGTTHVGVWLAEPNKSTATAPGRFRLQREVELAKHRLPTYDLTGPYRFEGRLAPAANETQLPTPGRAGFSREDRLTQSRIGIYHVLVTFALGTEETVAGPINGQIRIDPYPLWGEDDPAGTGFFKIFRPPAPAGATGWYAYVLEGGQNYRAYDKYTGVGRARPWPLSTRALDILGWQGGEKWAKNTPILLAQQSPPDEETTAIPAPTSDPEPPTVQGAVAPDPGRIYFRVADTLRGVPSLPSPATAVDLAFGEYPRVLFRDPTNLFANGDHEELTADGYPTDHDVPVTTGGAVRVEAGDLVLETNGAQTGTTPRLPTDRTPIDPAKPGLVQSFFSVANPPTGSAAGQVETVLVQVNAQGTETERVVHTTNGIGEFRVAVKVETAGTVIGPGTGPFAWQADTRFVRLYHRHAGTSKNLLVRVVSKGVKNHKYGHRPRLTKPPFRPAKPSVRGRAPAGGGVAIEPPPEPIRSPETFPVPFPDRPLSRGKLLDNPDLNAGAPAGWTPTATNGATLSYDAAAELLGVAGGRGLILKDAGTTAQATAHIGKAFAGPEGRHDLGQWSRNRFAVLPGGGHVELHAIRRTDARGVTWLQFGSIAEQASLRITGPPTAPGDVAVTLDGVRTAVPINAVRERAVLNLTANPTAGGTVAVTLGGVTKNVQVPGTQEVFRLGISTGASANASVTVTLAGKGYAVPIKAGMSYIQVAYRIATYHGYPGWRVSRSSNILTFTSLAPGPLPNSTFGAGATGVKASATTPVEGTVEPASGLAESIRATPFEGWMVEPGATAADVAWTAVDAGPKADAAYSPGGTGATGSMTTPTQGVADTAVEVAAKVRATAFLGWVTGGSGEAVVFTSAAGGQRQEARYEPGTSKTPGFISTVRQGTGADLTAHVREDGGRIQGRRLFSNLAATDVWLVDQDVSGAGTEDGIVSVWGSLNGGTRSLLARWENLDLSDSRVRWAEKGIAFESAPGTTWELHVDDVRITDRGDSYFRDHNARGELLYQAHGYFLPEQPIRDDLYLQDFRFAVVPGQTYCLSAFFRHEGAAGSARPLSVTAYRPGGAAVAVQGLDPEIVASGDEAWSEKIYRFVAPQGCYEAVVSSRAVGGGEFACQELYVSPGDVPRRGGGYALSGSYATTLPLGDPDPNPVVRLGRKRKSLRADVDVPAGSSAVVRYYASASRFGPWEGPFLDPLLVPEYDFVRVEVTGSGDGLSTFAVKAGSPRAEYVLLSGLRPVATLLKADRSELPGGATFKELEEWAERPGVANKKLPNGRRYRQKMFDPVGEVPPGEIQIHTAEAREYLEQMGELELLVLEGFGEILTIKTGAPFRFKRQTTRFGDGRGHWIAPFPESEIVARRPMP